MKFSVVAICAIALVLTTSLNTAYAKPRIIRKAVKPRGKHTNGEISYTYTTITTTEIINGVKHKYHHKPHKPRKPNISYTYTTVEIIHGVKHKRHHHHHYYPGKPGTPAISGTPGTPGTSVIPGTPAIPGTLAMT